MQPIPLLLPLLLLLPPLLLLWCHAGRDLLHVVNIYAIYCYIEWCRPLCKQGVPCCLVGFVMSHTDEKNFILNSIFLLTFLLSCNKCVTFLSFRHSNIFQFQYGLPKKVQFVCLIHFLSGHTWLWKGWGFRIWGVITVPSEPWKANAPYVFFGLKDYLIFSNNIKIQNSFHIDSVLQSVHETSALTNLWCYLTTSNQTAPWSDWIFSAIT